MKANEKGKIKIKKIEDNTAKDVEILIHLPSGVSPDKTIDALYAFTNCEVSISPLCCIIENNKPVFIGVKDALKHSTNHTVDLLTQELEIQLAELEEQWHFSSLERIFIENRIYRDIEEEETWQGVIDAIDKGLKPHIKHLKRAVTEEDIVKLTEIRIKKISKFDIDKAKQFIEGLEEKIALVKKDLANIIEYTINYFKDLKAKFGAGKERKTDIRIFEDIVATKVVLRNSKLYVNRAEGFIGTALRKDEFVADCADIDDVIVFRSDGKMMVTKVESKTFVGKDIIHVAVFKKKDKRTIYNMVYKDGKSGFTYMKRFAVTSITRDKEYDLTTGSKGSKMLYFTANPNGEAEVITINLRAVGLIKKLKWDVDLAELAIKGRASRGNIVTKYSIRKIELKEKGVSTLKPRKIWFDETVQRLNVDERGDLIGEFTADDRLLIINQKGEAKTIIPNLNTHFESDMIVLEKWKPNKPISVVYLDGERERYYVKRFMIEHPDREERFITDHAGSKLMIVAMDFRPMAEVIYSKRSLENEILNFEDFIAVKGIKALGNQFTAEKIKDINLLDPLPYEEPVLEEVELVEEEIIEIPKNTIEETSEEQNEDKDDENDDDGQTTLF